MIFVDSGAFFAWAVPNDSDHKAAKTFFSKPHREPFITTDYVIDEVLTLLRARNENQRASILGEMLITGSISKVHWVTQLDFRNAWVVFNQFEDKEWSFTDCVSKVVIESHGIKKAFAFDDHFRQFGTAVVLP